MPNFLMIDLQGKKILDEEKVVLQHANVGAILLFTRNYANPEQLKTLVNEVRAIRPDIFIAVDHEGGKVQRFQGDGFTRLPAAHLYGETYDQDNHKGIKLAEENAEIMARELLACGVDMSLAPVVDIHGDSEVIGKFGRAFHEKPEVVIELAAAFIRGMHKAGMPATGKHFPGHGSVHADSHTSTPFFRESAATLRDRDLKPFAELIERNTLDAIMPAHVTYTHFDAENPAGFSEIWLQKILRSELNFKGLVISDCLSMTGADIGDMSTRVNKALTAGCDMVIICNQSRELLLQIVQQTFMQANISCQRIADFTSKMARFSSAKHDKISPSLENLYGEKLNHTPSI
jgi:beta-N-acetylhexosaminidase